MAPGRSSHVSSPAPVVLPKVSFRKVEDEDVNEPAGVTDPTSRAYGYNDFSLFTRPEHYIRYIEPLESELSVQVEYDMDEQDQEWLDLINEERRKAQVGPVSSEIFEVLMDRLEKEWFELMKRVPKSDIGLPSEDSTCAICDDGEGENSNAIVFCDGCNLAVHQDCYGVPYIPEGQWLCRKCTVSPEVPVACVFCPNEGGAFKQTSTGLWAHLLCAMFIPEVTVGNTMFMEPIENIDHVPKSRWKLTCSLCKIRHGACIQCDKTTCFAAFHVTCARRAKLLMGMKGHTGEETGFKGFCEKHLPDDVKGTRGDVMDTFEGPLTIQSRTPKSSKTARAYSKKYTLGAPLVPQYIVDKLEVYYKKQFRQKQSFIQLICKYWSLKREARRGAPLLKRLHLEPWTASAQNKKLTDDEKALKYHYLKNLREDFVKVEILTGWVQRREKTKLSQAQLLHHLITSVLFPHQKVVRHAFEQIQSLDKNELFLRPVTRAEAPDYFDIIKDPMCFMTIEDKLNRGEYLHLDAFKIDVNLIFDNAMLYNKRDTVFHKTASRLKTAAANIIGPLYELPTLCTDIGGEAEGVEENTIGNLEADLDVLNLMFSNDNIKDDMNLVLDTDPLTSLLRTEQPFYKPPPPKVPKPKKEKPEKPEKPKRDYKLERQRRKEAHAAFAAGTAALFDTAPGFRGPRATRSSGAPLVEMDISLLSQPNRLPPFTTFADAASGNDFETSQTPSAGVTENFVDGPITPSVKPRSWRREHLVLPGQGIPNMVESMDDHNSFKNFDRGWILPSGSRRHGRTIPESSREYDHSPRKRQRIDSSKSTEKEPEAQMSYIAHSEQIEEVGVNDMVPSATFPDVPSTLTTRQKRSTSTGTNASNKFDKQSPPTALPKSRKKGKKQATTGPARPKAAGPLAGIIDLQEGEFLPGGTLVWAKMESYPWWAAVVWEEDTKGVPAEVLRSKEDVVRTEGGPLTLVQFYDRSKSWQWLELGNLRLLGEDKALDDMLLSGRGKMQNFRTPRLKQNCRKAYREAVAEMEDPGDGDDTKTASIASDHELQIDQTGIEDKSVALSSELSELDS
ncbi:hypothetical protein Clacol_005557 [Clathrus columnatus]|uniref:Peregrin n=1 Tax=Clathrus columnatus TaxID=1419009 RepID=A0AAV5AAH3_9AGAM|nr:hypothetical protein Clacol_005557 [Clathrus columnatus]